MMAHGSERGVLLIGDLHAGSEVGLWDDYTTKHGRLIQGSAANKILLDYWAHFTRWARRTGYDVVVLLGDLVDGANHKEFGNLLVSVLPQHQIEVASQLLEPLCKAKRVYSVNGSKYHQTKEMDVDSLVAGKVHGEPLGKIRPLKILGTDTRILVRHGDSASMLYRETAMARESVYLQAAQQKLGYSFDLIVGGHWHWYGRTESDVGGHIVANVSVPGFKLFFPWKSKLYGRWLPTIGGVILKLSTKQGLRILVPHYDGKPFYPYVPFYDQAVAV